MRKDLAAVGIIGSGLATPPRVVTNDDLSKILDTSDEWISTRTGIRQRRILGEGQDTSDLGAAAGLAAIADAGLTPADIDTIICATISGDMAFPNTACAIQAKIGAPHGAAFDVGAACSGYVYAFVTAASLIQTGRATHVLVIGADCPSKFLDWTDRTTSVLFGDGSGASVVAEVPNGYGILGSTLGCDGEGGALLHLGPRADAPEGRNYIQMNGREVYRFAVKTQTQACRDALADAEMSIEQIDWLVPHQANARIMELAAQRLGVPEEKMISNVAKYGNTSAASIPIALAEAAGEGKFKRGDYVLAVGFGAGLTWGSVVLRWY